MEAATVLDLAAGNDPAAGEPGLDAIAYSYGCPWNAELPEEVAEQLRLANMLWNRLVEIHRRHEEAKAAIWLSDPAVAVAQTELNGAEEEVSAAYEHMRESRRQDRTTVPREADSAVLEAAKGVAKAARAVRDAARDTALPGLREAFGEAKRARAGAVKATYPEFTGMGLGWGTCNDVTRRRFALAAGRVEESRASGRSADLRFHRWDGTGTLTVQVMGGAGVPSRTVPALNGGKHPRSGVMRLEPWADPSGGRPKGDARHGTLRLAIGRARGTGALNAEVPVVLDRYMPAHAEVREVKVTRFRQGTRFRLKVSVVAGIPGPPAPAPGGAQVAVRLSWRAAKDGSVVVAHVGSGRPLPPPPAAAAGIVRISEDGRSAEVHYSAEWRRLLERDAGIRSVRDQNLDILRDKVTAVLRDDPALAEELEVTAADVQRWRAPRRFAVLAARWPAGHPLAGTLAEWRLRDRHLWDYEAHESAQVLARRRDAYRVTAAWLCSGASGIVIDGTDVAGRKRAPGDDREDPEGARGARRLMHGAAPGELRAAVTAAAARRGIPVTAVKETRARGRGEESGQ